jgi:hypothetical protein
MGYYISTPEDGYQIAETCSVKYNKVYRRHKYKLRLMEI